MPDEQQGWRITGLAVLPVRFVQGWIFWGGGSRRFIYDPTKLDPDAHEWMANKLQSAMPGAILGVDRIINYILLHFDLLYFSIIMFSLIELFSGLALITGFCTRLAAFTTVLISIVLMLAFGWQGATCMDEWTMAVGTLAMGATLTLSGGSAYSFDNLIRHYRPTTAKRWWYPIITSGPLKPRTFKLMTRALFFFTVIFTLLTYNYYRGSIFTPYHSGLVSAGKHHISLSDGTLTGDGKITLTMYVDGGTPALPSNIIRIELLNAKKDIVTTWSARSLSNLPGDHIKNKYAYNRMHTGRNGLVAPLSAEATVILPPEKPMKLTGSGYELAIYTINGNRFEMPLKKK